jgi:hypothetical protein
VVSDNHVAINLVRGNEAKPYNHCMFGISDEMITKIGRVAVGATELEIYLATLACLDAGGNTLDIISRPGGALREARQVVQQMDAPERLSFTAVVDQIEGLLKRRHSIVHSMWINEAAPGGDPVHIALHPRTKTRIPEEDFALDELMCEMRAARGTLASLMTKRLNNRASGSPTSI